VASRSGLRPAHSTAAAFVAVLLALAVAMLHITVHAGPHNGELFAVGGAPCAGPVTHHAQNPGDAADDSATAIEVPPADLPGCSQTRACEMVADQRGGGPAPGSDPLRPSGVATTPAEQVNHVQRGLCSHSSLGLALATVSVVRV
jgi:hypothetical protein